MSGHSKWSKVKHQKASTDAVKGKAFTLASHAITIAVREGGGVADPSLNFRLRLAIEKARAVNMPKENIARAVDRAAGAGAVGLEQVIYEGFGPAGIALIIEAMTDNRQRTVSFIKNILEKHGGTLAAPGAVRFLFSQAGIITVEKAATSYDEVFEIAANAGAQDAVEAEDVYEIYTSVAEAAKVRQKLASSGLVVDNMEIIMKPITPIAIDADMHRKLDGLLAALEGLEDVTMIFHNADGG